MLHKRCSILLLCVALNVILCECAVILICLPTGYLSKLLLSFSLCKNASKILSADASPADGSTLQAVHGIRFLSMSWVILGHSWAFTLGYSRKF